MSSFRVIQDEKEEINSGALNNSSVKHQVEKKRIRTVGNFNCNGAPLSAIATSSAEFSMTSTAEGKSVISSVSMSMERKNSIRCMRNNVAPCMIPAGQSTVIHLDNYTHFLEQRVTTKTAIKKTEIIGEGHSAKMVPCLTTNASSSIVDVGLKVFLAGVNSSCNSNSKTLDMNKQKLLVSNSTTRSKRGRTKSLGLDYKKLKDNKMKIVPSDAPDGTTSQIPIIKKTTTRRKKVIKPRQSRKSKIKTITGGEQAIINEATRKEELAKLQISSNTQSSSESKILQPCVYTMQSRKCLSEMSCRYLHSDFPCKYYYLNLLCPQGFKCQFMHNGPLEPKLIEALRSHILDLLSTKPSAVETYFIQQIHNIEDLSQRLQSFQNTQGQNYEVIELMDDGDEDQVLFIDETSDDANTNILSDTMTTDSLSNTRHEADKSQVLQLETNKLDTVYEKFIETNSKIDEIDRKLKNLKNSSNMTPNEKIHELQNIYDLLKEQEKRLPIYENLNTATTAQILTTYDNCNNAALPLPSNEEQPHIVLVNPDIVNNIQISDSEEKIVTITGDENTMTLVQPEYLEPTISNVPQLVGTVFLSYEDIPQQAGSEPIINEDLHHQDVRDNNEVTFLKDGEINDFIMPSNMDNAEESTKNIETILNNSNLNFEENYTKTEPNSEQIVIDSNVLEILQLESKQRRYHTLQTSDASLEKNNSLVSDKNEKVDEKVECTNSIIIHNETLEVDITNDENEVIENSVKDIASVEHVEEKSPSYENIKTTKPAKTNRIRLRSHTLQDNVAFTTNNVDSEHLTATSIQPIKAIRTRRLRLPKPSQKTIEKSNIDECQINADVINKLIKSTDTYKNLEDTNKDTKYLKDVEDSLTPNAILTKRFLKRAKARHEKQTILDELQATDCNSDIDANLEQNMLALHSAGFKNHNSIENGDNLVNKQTSNDSSSLNSLQENNFRDIPTSNENLDNIRLTNKDKKKPVSGSLKLPVNILKSETLKKLHSKRRISFENPTSSLTTLSSTNIKEQFNLGNPHVVLTKLKTPFLVSTTEKDVPADSIIPHVNPIVNSSTLLADDNSTQKRRHSLTSDHYLALPLKENKCLKIDNSISTSTVKIDKRNRTYSEQSSDSKDGDFDTDSSNEKLVIGGDALQTLCNNSNEKQEFYEPFLAHVVTTPQQQRHHHSHQLEHKEQQVDRSHIRQQFKNMSNELDLQSQTEKLKENEVEKTSISTGSSSIVQNSHNLPHKQYQQKEELLMVMQELVPDKQCEKNIKEKEQFANTSNSYDNIKNIFEPEKLTSTPSNKYSNETNITEHINVEHSTYSSLFNKLSTHSTKRPIHFENFSVNITPISSPTYGDNTIASPSPIRKSVDFRMGGEIDGRLTYPPITYILHEIDLGKIAINQPMYIDKLKKTIQLDPRIFRTNIKKQSITLCKPVEATSASLVPITTSNTLNLSNDPFIAQPTKSMISHFDPRNRTTAITTDIPTPSLSHQTALSPPSSSSFMHTGMPNAVPLALQYHSTSQAIIQPQLQQTPNMFLYGCLQRSPWYQSLMSTLKIQINQSISQLVRALNNYHRERLFNPELVFDLFKIDCAGELLEIMRNLGVFVDANGVINEQRHVPSASVRSCCNATPVNATYSFIQQVLTPNTHCTSLTTSSSTYNAAGCKPIGQFNVNEPFVSCYIKTPEPVQKCSDNNVSTHHSHHDDNNSDINYNNNRNDINNNYNNHNNNRRYGNQFKKPYDNNGSNYQQRSNQRCNNYNNNPRFMKPGCSSPTRSNSSPPNSPRNGSDGSNSSSYGAGGWRGSGRGGGRGGGARFNNNRRFNNYNNDDNNNCNGSSWSSSDSNDKRYNNKYQNNNSPSRNSSPNSSYRSESPRPAASINASPPHKSSKSDSKDEECWDSDN